MPRHRTIRFALPASAATRRLLGALLAMTVLPLVALAVAPPASAVDNTHPTVTTFHSSTYMVGDSLTAGGKRFLQRLRPWDIDGFPGRNVDALPDYLRLRLASPVPLHKVVIALGTNAVRGWNETSYSDAVALLPASTVVVFVTTFRDPTEWRAPQVPDYRREAWVQWHYTADMEQVAATRPHTCLVPWREFARRHRNLLIDGTHPTYAGHIAWAHLVAQATEHCR